MSHTMMAVSAGFQSSRTVAMRICALMPNGEGEIDQIRGADQFSTRSARSVIHRFGAPTAPATSS